MAEQLGFDGAAVHDGAVIAREAERVIRFWLDEVPAEKRFTADPELDARIGDRFGALREAVMADPDPWRATGRTALAAIILVDQFSRNLHRGDARAFEGDALALDISRAGVDAGQDEPMTGTERQFFYMPFMHSEALDDQRRGLGLFARTGNDEAVDFARRHLEQIERFGRFPQRNEALGRESTAEEIVFLEQPGSRF